MRILLVGGAVRNLLLGIPVRDRDYLVLGGTVEAFMREHPQAKPVGKSFPVFILDGQEYCFLRGHTLADDFALRDFTVNAMALDEDGTLLCHADALEDLSTRTLRHASERSLADDPLRVFRAARFVAQLPEFSPHSSLLGAMREASRLPEFPALSAERVGQEVLKACASERPGEFLRVLQRAGCLGHWFEEFVDAVDIPAGPPRYHDASVLEHTARLMDALAGAGESCGAICVWMALCHDLGKTLTPRAELPRHIGHEARGEALALALGHRLRLPMRYINAGADAARWHMLAGDYPTLRPATRVDLLFRLKHRAILREMFLLARVDKGVDHLQEALADLAVAEPLQLPQELCGLGAESGARLRQMRIAAVRSRLNNAMAKQ